jgi:hypothetical protein
MRSRMFRVSDSFAAYVERVQKNVSRESGKNLSSSEITAILANVNPIIKVELKRKKRLSLFDL